MPGRNEKKANQSPYLWNFCLKRIIFSWLILNHFSIQSNFPKCPIQKQVKPPNQLPNVAQKTQIQGLKSEKINAEKTISELKGTIVAAKNAAINKPKYPKLIKNIFIRISLLIDSKHLTKQKLKEEYLKI